jgi:ArsR family metal-binding transcriptional regulator
MRKVGETISNCFNILGVAVSVQDITNFLNLLLLIISLVNMSLILFFNLKDKIDKAKADGKVTKEEIEDIKDTAVEGVNEIKDKIDEYKEDK